ncbi:MAG TPA: hypothetical protein VGV38_08350 [Pyrinomonadaceae bacterium]|nr:hypothetical protein [Pyrinomonadaceae bacterium]
MKQQKSWYKELHRAIAEVLFRHDPVGIASEENADEYEPEARTILAKLDSCRSTEDVLWVVHKDFQGWFTPEIAGPRERYREAAEEIWRLWRLRNRRGKGPS